MTTSLRPDRLPTLEDLLFEQSKQGYDYPNTAEHIQKVIDLLTEIPELYTYIWEKYGDPELDIPFLTYGYLTDFIKHLYEQDDYDFVRKIFLYIERKRNDDDEYMRTLICDGCIDGFYEFREYMPEIFEYMPTELKELYLGDIPDGLFYEIMGRLRRPGEFGSS